MKSFISNIKSLNIAQLHTSHTEDAQTHEMSQKRNAIICCITSSTTLCYDDCTEKETKEKRNVHVIKSPYFKYLFTCRLASTRSTQSWTQSMNELYCERMENISSATSANAKIKMKENITKNHKILIHFFCIHHWHCTKNPMEGEDHSMAASTKWDGGRRKQEKRNGNGKRIRSRKRERTRTRITWIIRQSDWDDIE